MSGWRHKTIQALHQQYGKVVRIGEYRSDCYHYDLVLKSQQVLTLYQSILVLLSDRSMPQVDVWTEVLPTNYTFSLEMAYSLRWTEKFISREETNGRLPLRVPSKYSLVLPPHTAIKQMAVSNISSPF